MAAKREALDDRGKRDVLGTAEEEEEYGAVGIVFLHGEEGDAGATTVGVIGRWREFVEFLEFDEQIGVLASVCEEGEDFLGGEEIGGFVGCGLIGGWVIGLIGCIGLIG